MAFKREKQCVGQYAICLPGRQAQQSWHVLLELNAMLSMQVLLGQQGFWPHPCQQGPSQA